MNKKQLRKKLALMLANLKKKRKYYTEVEYLESDSTAYIDTGVSGGNDNLKIEMGFSYSKFYSYGYFFANYESEQHNTTRFVLDSTNNSIGLAYINTRSSGGAIYPRNITMNDKHSLVLTKTTCSIDGVIATNPNPPVGAANTKNIVLFNRGSGSYASTRDIGMRCYYFRIYDNGVLVRDFIPVLDWDMKPCMYDKVSGELFYNKGTGDNFLYGRQIHPVEYLESTGTQYIDTGIYGTEDLETELVCQQLQRNAQDQGKGIFGAFYSNTANSYYLYQQGSTISNWQVGFGSFTNTSTEIDLNKHTFKFSDYKVYMDGIQIETLNAGSMNTTEHTLLLFNTHNNSGGIYPALPQRFYRANFVKNGVLIGDFIPAVDENDTFFMFDKITHTAYNNAGSGSFIGPTVAKDGNGKIIENEYE